MSVAEKYPVPEDLSVRVLVHELLYKGLGIDQRRHQPMELQGQGFANYKSKSGRSQSTSSICVVHKCSCTTCQSSQFQAFLNKAYLLRSTDRKTCLMVAGSSSVSAVQTCCDSPSLSLAPSSMLPRQRRVPVFQVPGRQHLRSARCHQLSVLRSTLRPVHFLSPDQQSGIHCLIICTIQLLTRNNLGGT